MTDAGRTPPHVTRLQRPRGRVGEWVGAGEGQILARHRHMEKGFVTPYRAYLPPNTASKVVLV